MTGLAQAGLMTVADSVPIVGDAIEIFDTVRDVRQKGIVNTGIRTGLNLVPNGPWASVAEGAARTTTGKGWEEVAADWVTGAGKPKQGASQNPDEVDLDKKEREQVVAMSKETVASLKNADKIGDIMEKNMKKLEEIKDPEKRAAMIHAYCSMAEADVKMAAAKDGIISEKEHDAVKKVQEAVANAGHSAPDHSAPNQRGVSRGGIV